MTLTETLQIKERFLKFEDMRALDYVEKRWQQEECPTERWQLINFLEKMLRELKDQGGYPKVLLLRKKEIQRRTFTVPQPGDVPAEGCPCFDGYLLSGTVCVCPKGDRHREKLRKWGMQI
jgi:hypothetical protein